MAVKSQQLRGGACGWQRTVVNRPGQVSASPACADVQCHGVDIWRHHDQPEALVCIDCSRGWAAGDGGICIVACELPPAVVPAVAPFCHGCENVGACHRHLHVVVLVGLVHFVQSQPGQRHGRPVHARRRFARHSRRRHLADERLAQCVGLVVPKPDVPIAIVAPVPQQHRVLFRQAGNRVSKQGDRPLSDAARSRTGKRTSPGYVLGSPSQAEPVQRQSFGSPSTKLR